MEDSNKKFALVGAAAAAVGALTAYLLFSGKPKASSLQSFGRHLPSAVQEGCDKPAIRVAITGAAGQIGSFLCHFVGQGRMFGPYQKVILHLIELPFAQKFLDALVMELKDSAYRNIVDIVATTSADEGFKDVDAAILVGAIPRGPGMERKDLLEKNANIFKAQGKSLDQHAKKTVKVLVIGNPCNTNCLIASSNAPSIPKKNFTAMTRLDQTRALSMIAEKTGKQIDKDDIKDIIVWGNHSTTQYPDTHFATINGKAVREQVETDWLDGDFIKRVAGRGGEIIKVSGKSSAASAAAAACEHMHDWWFGNQRGGLVSMGVIVEKATSYGVDTDLCYSYPVNIDKNGEWTIVDNLKLN